MKRRTLTVTGRRIAARKVNFLFVQRTPRLRKLISMALIFTFVLIPLLKGNTLVAPSALAQINVCGGATRIIQDCPLNPNYEVAIENQALDDLLTFHQLPAGDRSRLLGWQRNELRALLYADLQNLIKKAPASRTTDEQNAYTALANRIKQLRVTAAQKALDEYNIWNGNKCNYQPPPGFSYDGRLRCAAARLNPTAAGPPDPPKFEEFQAYGVARAYERLYAADAQDVSAGTAHAAQLFGGLGGAAIVGGIAALATYSVLAADLALATAFAEVFEEIEIGSIALASGLGSAAAAVGGAVFVAVAAVVIGVLRGIDVANIAAIPGKLQDKLTEQTNAPVPDLSQLIDTEQGKRELYAAFILMTLPDFPSTDSVPGGIL